MQVIAEEEGNRHQRRAKTARLRESGFNSLNTLLLLECGLLRPLTLHAYSIISTLAISGVFLLSIQNAC